MMRLLVIVPDRLSQIVEKGEVQPSYYNPGNLADEVHILMTNDDAVALEPLQYMAGNAKLFVHNYPEDSALPQRRWPWRDGFRLRRWAKGGVELVRSIRPDMIRCHGADWNAYLASCIKKELGIPYCVSLHINPDINPTRRFLTASNKVEERFNAFYEYLETQALLHADMVLPVYKPILAYLQRKGVSPQQTRVCYNILNTQELQKKESYAARVPFRVICVGRLIAEKNPVNILHALVKLPGVQFTIVGEGSIRPELEQMAADLGLSDRVIFRPAIPNGDLCALLAEQDMFVVHTDYYELNKSVLEALLTGLPVIINKRPGAQVPEFAEGDFVHMVGNTPEGYYTAMYFYMNDDTVRENLGKRAYAHAWEHWGPRRTEAAYVNVYKELLRGHNV